MTTDTMTQAGEIPMTDVVDRAIEEATAALKALQRLAGALQDREAARAKAAALAAVAPARPPADDDVPWPAHEAPVAEDLREARRDVREAELGAENHAWMAVMHADALYRWATEAYHRTER